MNRKQAQAWSLAFPVEPKAGWRAEILNFAHADVASGVPATRQMERGDYSFWPTQHGRSFETAACWLKL